MASSVSPPCAETQENLLSNITTLQVHKGGIILRVHVMKWAVTGLCWPPSAITFQHKNTTVWERGDPFTHLAECLHSHYSKNRPRNPPSVHLLSLHHSALKEITGRSMSCISWSCRTSTLLCYFTPLWPELSATPDSVKQCLQMSLYRTLWVSRSDFISWWWFNYEDITYAGRRTHTNARITHCS